MRLSNKDLSWLTRTPIAHRGLHNILVAENSLSAIKNAYEAGYNIEIDVHKTKDNGVVVHDDYDLLRSCGVDKKISDLTLAEVQKYHIFGTDEHIPKLIDVISLVPNANLLIEIKNEGTDRALEDLTIQTLKNFHGNFAIQSFNPFSIRHIAKIDSSIAIGILSSAFKKEKMSGIKKFLLSRMIFARPKNVDFVSYNIDDIPNNYINKYKIKLAWVCRSENEYSRIQNDVDNIIFEHYTPPIKK